MGFELLKTVSAEIFERHEEQFAEEIKRVADRNERTAEVLFSS